MKLIILALAFVFPVTAMAQSIPQMSRKVTLDGPAGLNWAFSRKADADRGTLNAPTLTGSGDIPFIPKGSPLAGSVGSVVVTLGLNHAGVQNFGHNIECTSSSVAPAAGGNTCNYTWTESLAASGQIWNSNSVLQLDGGFNTGLYSAISDERDINNLAGDYGEFSTANSIGTLYNGLGKMNTAATSVQTGNSASGMTGTAGQLAIWYYGHHIGPNAVYEADWDSQSDAVYGLRQRGANTYGITLADDNTAAAGILLGNLGPRQGIVGRNGSVQYTMMYMATDGSIHIGNLTQANWQSDGNILPVTDATYSLGSSTNRWNNAFLQNVNGIPAIAEGTPGSGTCVPGAQQYDATKFYMCLTDSKWHTMATASN